MIELDAITKVYTKGFLRQEKMTAVNNVSLNLEKGMSLGLVGESGSGKTTLGRIALRLVEPTSGTVRFDGVNLTALSRSALRQIRPRMQIVFQDPDTSLDPRMTVRECIAEPLKIWNLVEPQDREDRVFELLELVGLQPDLIGRFPFEISGGQKQRVRSCPGARTQARIYRRRRTYSRARSLRTGTGAQPDQNDTEKNKPHAFVHIARSPDYRTDE